jgi:hypothetical protein
MLQLPAIPAIRHQKPSVRSGLLRLFCLEYGLCQADRFLRIRISRQPLTTIPPVHETAIRTVRPLPPKRMTCKLAIIAAENFFESGRRCWHDAG